MERESRNTIHKVLNYLLPFTALCLAVALFATAFSGRTTEPQEEISQEILDGWMPSVASTDVPMTPAQVYASQVGAVAGIRTESTTTNVFGQKSSIASSGSGFVITPDGYVVTNYHVVEGANSITVSLYSGEDYPAEVIGGYAENDIALLKIAAKNLPYAILGRSEPLFVGEQVATIGNPLGELTYSMTVGYISALDRQINASGSPINMLQTDVAINSGNSGGPIFDMYGNVVAVASAKYSGKTASGAYIEGLSFAIPAEDVLIILNELKQHGYVSGRPYLGVGVRDLDASVSQIYGLPIGAFVATVEEGSCAERAGVQEGDLITALDENIIKNSSDLFQALKALNAGDRVALELYRQGRKINLKLVLDEKDTKLHIPIMEESA